MCRKFNYYAIFNKYTAALCGGTENKMRKMKRCVHFDFHTMPGIDDILKNYSAEDFAETMRLAEADYVNIFARCNIGFSYYPTKAGTPYPGMKGDMVGDTVRELHKRNIGVTLYINGGLNHELLARNPGMSKINRDGTICIGTEKERINNNFFRSPCFLGEYRAHLLAEIKEMLAYDPDGIFIDCLRAGSCFCPICMERMRKEGVNTASDEAVYEFAVKVVMELMREIKSLVPEGKRLYLNSFPYEMIADMSTHAELECLPSDIGEWGYDFFPTEAPYHRMYDKTPVYMTGRFINSWGDIAGNKPIASIENDVYDALLYGYAPSVGDHMHPRDGVDKSLYQSIGRTYSMVKQLEKWTDGTEPHAEVGILRNMTTSLNIFTRITDSAKGVTRMLSELKINHNVVNESMDLSPYKLLIIPEGTALTDMLMNKLEAFSGKIISAGNSIKESPVWDYIESCEPDGNTDGFYFDGCRVQPMYICGIKMKSGSSLYDYVEPYFNKHYDGYHGYFYIPPKDKSGYSAVALGERSAHICFNIFSSYAANFAECHKALVGELIDRLMGGRLIMTDLPVFTRASLMCGDGYSLLHVKTDYPEHRGQRGVIEEHLPLAEGFTVSVLGEYRSVKALPEYEELDSRIDCGRTVIKTPRITGYKCFVFEK